MGIYQYIRDIWKRPRTNELWTQRLIQWRKEPTTIRIERPTRLDRARDLGYKAKTGIFMVRQRVARGGRMRPQIRGPRKPRKMRRKKILAMNYQSIAERRANKEFPNCEVLNSYWVAQDGKYYWYEIILVDKEHPNIKADKNLQWMSDPQHRKRAFRGLTSANRKSRGLRNKGKGAEKIRPSLRAKGRTH